MKRIIFAALFGSGLLTATMSQASMDFVSTTGSEVTFGPGQTFNIVGGITDTYLGTAQWQINDGGAAGLYGAFGGGPWTYGTITSSSGNESANVTTPGGTISIADASGDLLTGNVNWVQIYTYGATGGLNAGATVNITSLAYSGSNSALQALAAGNDGSVDLTFQFTTAESLTELSSGGTYDAGSYSGSIAPVPEPTTMIAGALLLLPFGASTLRILRRNRMA